MLAGVLLGLLVAGDVTGALMVSAGSDPADVVQLRRRRRFALRPPLRVHDPGLSRTTGRQEAGFSGRPVRPVLSGLSRDVHLLAQ
jgi:hypothetical protein